MPLDLTIKGVSVRELSPYLDIRGSLTEIHRDEWDLAPRPVQWDFIFSKEGSLRGVHVHCLRWDYFVVLEGKATLGLNDLRSASPTFRQPLAIEISGPRAVSVPPGVAHGIYARTDVRYLYGLTVLWDGTDEDIGCRHNDPALGIEWPAAYPIMLQRDLELGSYEELVERYAAKIRS